jgi:hypothetical protein
MTVALAFELPTTIGNTTAKAHSHDFLLPLGNPGFLLIRHDFNTPRFQATTRKIRSNR